MQCRRSNRWLTSHHNQVVNLVLSIPLRLPLFPHYPTHVPSLDLATPFLSLLFRALRPAAPRRVENSIRCIAVRIKHLWFVSVLTRHTNSAIVVNKARYVLVRWRSRSCLSTSTSSQECIHVLPATHSVQWLRRTTTSCPWAWPRSSSRQRRRVLREHL